MNTTQFNNVQIIEIIKLKYHGMHSKKVAKELYVWVVHIL